MATLLVSDTSVLIDLDRGAILREISGAKASALPKKIDVDFLDLLRLSA
jgi:hypothetical protein